MADYHDWLAKAGVALFDIGASRTKAGTLDAAIAAYRKSDAFTKGLAEASQDMRRPILDNFANKVGKDGRRYGEHNIATLRSRHLQAMLEGMTHHAKKNWRKTIRHLMLFTVASGMRSDDPTQGMLIERGRKSMGHVTWLEPQVEQYRQHHALGTMARLALELLLNIAARRYDAHEIGPQHMIISNKDGVKKLCWRPHKTLRTTGKMLKIRVIPAFQAALDAMPKSEKGVAVPLAFILNEYGRPFASAGAFGNRFADWCTQAGLKPVICDDGKIRNYRAHGLRKAALRAGAHAGCTLHELMALSGHTSAKQLQEYLEEVEQEFMADNAMDKVVAAGGGR
jgi:integrase/recombinase XerD